MSLLHFRELCIVVAAVSATLFLPIAFLVARWWRYHMFQALVLSDLALAGLLVPIALHIWFDFVTPEWVVTLIVFLVAVTSVMRDVAVVWTKVAAMREERRAQDTPGDDLLDAPGAQM